MLEILEANPSIKGIIADLPHVLQNTQEILGAHGLKERCILVNCDFFKEIPKRGDAYILSHVLHDWEDERCQGIVENCYKVMGADSKLLIIEMVVPSGNEPSISKLLDLEVLVMGGGRERTEREFRELFDACGFRLNRIIPTDEGICVLECVKS